MEKNFFLEYTVEGFIGNSCNSGGNHWLFLSRWRNCSVILVTTEEIVGNSCIDGENCQLLSTTVCIIWRGGNILCELLNHWGGGTIG
mmetsp:Transcript_7552/g.16325  ORF Transcript_7552/g.16325 Transcript_7552/m.16325 type:complete len:87 (+) Transcript_7552:268-528(+)